jgi:hypothetical protein
MTNIEELLDSALAEARAAGRREGRGSMSEGNGAEVALRAALKDLLQQLRELRAQVAW